MEVDEGNQAKILRHANVEAIDDDEFFEFQEVESYYNPNSVGADEDTPVNTAKGTPTGIIAEADEIP